MAGDCHTIAAEPRKPSPAHKTIIELFREWEALGVEQHGLVSDDASGELIEAISVQRDGLERRMCAMKPATAGEMAAFLYAYTSAFAVFSDEAKLALDFIAAEESAGVAPKPLAAFSVDLAAMDYDMQFAIFDAAGTIADVCMAFTCQPRFCVSGGAYPEMNAAGELFDAVADAFSDLRTRIRARVATGPVSDNRLERESQFAIAITDPAGPEEAMTLAQRFLRVPA